MIRVLAPLLRRLTPFAFRSSVREEAWETIAIMLAARVDLSQALEQTAAAYQRRGLLGLLISNGLRDLRQAIGRGAFAQEAARLAGGAEALLFSRFDTANPERMFRGAARIARTDTKMGQAITSALGQPIFLLLANVGLLYFLGTTFFPVFEESAPRNTWPALARTIASASDFVAQDYGILALLLVAIILAIRATIGRDWPGRKVADLMPPWSFYKMRTGTAFIAAVIETARMGGDIKSTTLIEMGAKADPYVRARIGRIADELQRGNIGEAALAAGDGFPSIDLTTVLAVIANREGWALDAANFLERHLEAIERKTRQLAG
ncbi:hypothetical protein FGG78_23855, partial [Thioclava sp. BHET1]